MFKLACVHKRCYEIKALKLIEASALTGSNNSLDRRHGVVSRLLQLQPDFRKRTTKLTKIDFRCVDGTIVMNLSCHAAFTSLNFGVEATEMVSAILTGPVQCLVVVVADPDFLGSEKDAQWTLTTFDIH
jgi:hypothetical protein